jgi:hypothetical protein
MFIHSHLKWSTHLSHIFCATLAWNLDFFGKKIERQLVVTTLKKNGYLQNVFNELERKEKIKKEEDKKVDKEYKHVVAIPCIAGLSEAIRREGEKVGLKTVFTMNTDSVTH